MEKSLSFFRIFDLAFFLPGFLLLWPGRIALTLAALQPAEAKLSPEVDEVLRIASLLATSYILGMLTHALVRWPGRLVVALGQWLLSTKGLRWLARFADWDPRTLRASWLQKADSEQRRDLRGYFWYTKAACHNTGLALLFVAIIRSDLGISARLGLGASSIVLMMLSLDFDNALNRV